MISKSRMLTSFAASERGLTAFALVSVAAPSAALALFIGKFGVNVIFSDEWEMVPLYQSMVRSKLSLAELFAQHNEHRIFFPRLLMLLLERLSSFNVIAEMYFSWLLVTATVGLVFLIYLRDSGVWNLKVITYFWPISLLMLSFRQEEAVLWGFECQIYLTVFCVVASVFLLDGAARRTRFLPVSIIAGVIASYSFLLGLVVWPAGALQTALSTGDFGSRVRRLFVWVISGGLVSGAYLNGFSVPTNAGISHSPLRIAEYGLAFIGAPFTFELAYFSAAIACVLIIIASIAFIQGFKGGVIRANSVWISLMFFVCLSAVVTAIGRSGLGAAEALNSRYTPISCLGVVGLYSFAISASKHYNGMGRRFSVNALLTLFLLALIVSTGAGWHIGQRTSAERQIAVHVLQDYDREAGAPIVKYLYPNASFVREWAPFLEANRLSVFSRSNDTTAPEQNATTKPMFGKINEPMRMGPNTNVSMSSVTMPTFVLNSRAYGQDKL